MKHTEAIKMIMIEKKITQKDAAIELGLKSNATLSERINHKNISAKNLTEILDILGYELVIQPKTEGDRPDGQYVLERADYA